MSPFFSFSGRFGCSRRGFFHVSFSKQFNRYGSSIFSILVSSEVWSFADFLLYPGSFICLHLLWLGVCQRWELSFYRLESWFADYGILLFLLLLLLLLLLLVESRSACVGRRCIQDYWMATLICQVLLSASDAAVYIDMNYTRYPSTHYPHQPMFPSN